MRRLLAATLLTAGLAAPATALGAGGPVPPLQGGAGVTLPGAPVRFVALDVGHATVVERVSTRTGVVSGSRTVPGRFGVAAIAFDGTATGLSADGRTLVLADITTRYPPTHTRLLILDARRLATRDAITLRGYFSVDAISPSARWLYLIHYPSPNDALRYQVRALDLTSGKLLARPVVDPREPDEKMTGFALTRATSANGRWAYTLYQKPNGGSFIHALDTDGRTAHCIDLPGVAGDLSTVRLELGNGGSDLTVLTSSGPQVVLDTRTFAARAPALPATRPAAQPSRPREQGTTADSPWVLALLPLAALFAASIGLRRRRMRSSPA
jgi:hypothetical protein